MFATVLFSALTIFVTAEWTGIAQPSELIEGEEADVAEGVCPNGARINHITVGELTTCCIPSINTQCSDGTWLLTEDQGNAQSCSDTTNEHGLDAA